MTVDDLSSSEAPATSDEDTDMGVEMLLLESAISLQYKSFTRLLFIQ